MKSDSRDFLSGVSVLSLTSLNRYLLWRLGVIGADDDYLFRSIPSVRDGMILEGKSLSGA